MTASGQKYALIHICRVTHIMKDIVLNTKNWMGGIWKKDRGLSLMFFFLYIFINVVLFQFHEPWRDEAQAWLLSRDISFFDLPGQMHYEGHPCLWHMLIYVFAHTGFPYIMQTVMAMVVTGGAAAILLFTGPFPLYFRVLVILSPVFTYYYPVIARNYCLISLILMLLAYFYKSRHKRPVIYCLLIGMLVQTHAIMIFTAFGLGLCFLLDIIFEALDRKDQGFAPGPFVKKCLPLFIPFLSALLWLWEMWHDSENSGLLRVKTASVGRTLEKMTEALTEATDKLTGLGAFSKVMILVFLVLFVYVLMKSRDVFIVLVPTLCFQFWFYAMVYTWSVQKLISIPLLVIWALYIIEESGGQTPEVHRDKLPNPGGQTLTPEGQTPNPGGQTLTRGGQTLIPQLALLVFAMLFAINSLRGDIRDNIKMPYSNGEHGAEFIKNNIPEYKEAVFIADNEPEVTAMFPYLDRFKVVYAPTGKEFTYVTWDLEWNERSDYNTLKTLVSRYKDQGKEVYIISCPERSYVEENFLMEQDYELIYESPEKSIKGEDYRIFSTTP